MILPELFQLNERIEDIVSALYKYKDRDDIFISFRDLPKLGINPRSNYETPIGIYAYPLKEMWDNIVINKIPFAGDKPYIIVFQSVGNVPDVTETQPNGYTTEMLKADIEKIKEKFLLPYLEYLKPLNFGDMHRKTVVYRYYIRNLLSKDDDLLLKKLTTNVPCEFDPYYIIEQLLENDYSEIDALKKETSPKLFSDIMALAKEFHSNMEPLLITKIALADKIEDWIYDATFNTPAARFWNITRELAHCISSKKSSVTWTAIMYSLGYQGFTDKAGRGLIHSSEPCQAVFFGVKATKLIEVLLNKRKSETEIPNYEVLYVNTLRDFTAKIRNIKYGDDDKQINPVVNFKQIFRHIPELLSTGSSKFVKAKNPEIFKASIKDDLPYFFNTCLYLVSIKSKINVLNWYMNNTQYWTSESNERFVSSLFSEMTYYKYGVKNVFYIVDNKAWQSIALDPRTIKMIHQQAPAKHTSFYGIVDRLSYFALANNIVLKTYQKILHSDLKNFPM